MKRIRVRTEIDLWRMIFAVLIFAVVCDAVGIWMGWIARH